MATSSPTVDFAKCFSFVPEDPEWIKKLLIGGGFALLSSLLIGIPFVAGYWGRTLKRVAAGDPRPLPEWDDLGGIFGEGLKIALVGLAYGCVLLLVIASVGCVIAFFFMGAEALERQSRGAGSAMAALGGTGIVALYFFFIVAALAINLYLPAALVRVVLTGELSAGFDFGRHVAFIRGNLVNYLLSLLFYFVGSFAAQFGFILCCVGVFPLAFWAYLVLAYALGSTVRMNPGSV